MIYIYSNMSKITNMLTFSWVSQRSPFSSTWWRFIKAANRQVEAPCHWSITFRENDLVQYRQPSPYSYVNNIKRKNDFFYSVLKARC